MTFVKRRCARRAAAVLREAHRRLGASKLADTRISAVLFVPAGWITMQGQKHFVILIDDASADLS